jgi:Tfp pilus assembly protein PilN
LTESNIAIVEWSPDGARAYNPATRQSASGTTVAEALGKVGAAGAVGLCLSRRVSFVRETHVPAVEKSELRLIVQVQLENLFPAVRSDLAFDYNLGTHRYDDGVQTTVCAIQADHLRAAIKEVESAGARVAWAAPTALGAAHVAQASGHDDAIIVEREGSFLNLDIVRHGMLVYSRAVLAPDLREGRQSEVSRTLAGYGLPSAAVIAVGDTDLGEDVRRAQEGPLQAMSSHDPARANVELPEAVATKVKRASQAKSRLALFLWLAVVCVGALSYLDRAERADEVAAAQNKQKGQVTNLTHDVELYTTRLETVRVDLESLNLAFHPKQSVADVLTVVSNTLPRGAWLTGLSFERGEEIQIRGTALDGSVVSAYNAALAMESRFRDVQLVFANNAEIEGTPVVQFAITAHVVGNFPLVDDQGKRRTSR